MAFNGLTTALRTLTILPVPGRENGDFSSSLPWFPVVGLILGTAAALFGHVWFHVAGGWSSGGSALLLTGTVFLTRGLHLDGLADWADALGGRPDREIRLAIMKDPGLGTFGATALIADLLLKWVALERILAVGSAWTLLLPLVVSRTMMAEMASVLPYARSEPGTAEPFVRGASAGRRWAALILGFSLASMWGADGVLIFSGAWAATRLFSLHCSRVFGGVTGDLLGALNEILEAGILTACACVLPGPGALWYTIPGLF
jgi:adenosylcobinamide-GDP ribazoletransferase